MDIKEALSREDRHLGRHPWEIARLKIIHEFYDNALKILSDERYPIVTLDVGCGDLFVVNFLAAKYVNYKFIGVDSAIDSQPYKKITDAIAALNVEVYSSLEYMQNYVGAIDIVFLCDVLEHIEDDANFLKKLTSNIIMKPDAIFIITVPAFQKLFCSHDIFLNHFRRYRHEQLLQLAYQSKLKVVDYGYFFSTLLLPRLFQVIFERLFLSRLSKKNTGVGRWKGYGFIDSIVLRLLLMDYYFSRSMRKYGFRFWGLSCFMICKR